MRRFFQQWFFPIISLLIFSALLIAMLADMTSIQMSSLVSFSAGLLAYAMMLTVTFMGSRPRFIERKLGLPEMYEVHAQMSMVAFFMILLHMSLQFSGFDALLRSQVTQSGYLAFGSLVIVMFTGIFSLSGTFVNDIPKLRRFKETFMKRELALWLHRLAILAIIAVYAHLMLLPFLASNQAFVWILTGVTGFVLIYYLYWKLKIFFGPKVAISEIEAMTDDVWRIAFEGDKLKSYQPGDYFFIRLKGTNLGGEGHPFSVTSVPDLTNNNRVEFMIKESGDWSNRMKELKVGDRAQLEGPYGNFVPDNFDSFDGPIVLLSGGIGVTPNLALARQEKEKGFPRPVHFIWGLAVASDQFLLEELNDMAKHDNFHLHVLFSNEEVAGYDHGFITEDYLTQVQANLWQDAHYFACGPAPMLSAVSSILEARQVDPDRIHIDEFGF